MPTSAQTLPTDTTVVKAAIYPPIGIARVGNSPDAFYFAPEVPDPRPEAPGFYRDASGAIKREAARFRLYGLNAAGQAVVELTADNAEVAWAAIRAFIRMRATNGCGASFISAHNWSRDPRNR